MFNMRERYTKKEDFDIAMKDFEQRVCAKYISILGNIDYDFESRLRAQDDRLRAQDEKINFLKARIEALKWLITNETGE